MASEERPRASRAVAHLLLMQPAAHREPVEARHRRVLARTGVCTASLGRFLQMNLKLQTCMKHSESICTVGNGLLVSGTAITATSAGSRTPSSSGCTLQRCVMGFVRCLLRASAHSVNVQLVCMSTAKAKATLAMCLRNWRDFPHPGCFLQTEPLAQPFPPLRLHCAFCTRGSLTWCDHCGAPLCGHHWHVCRPCAGDFCGFHYYGHWCRDDEQTALGEPRQANRTSHWRGAWHRLWCLGSSPAVLQTGPVSRTRHLTGSQHFAAPQRGLIRLTYV